MEIAFLGLGNMGSGMGVSRLSRRGTSPGCLEPHSGKGRAAGERRRGIGGKPEAAVAQCEIVMTSLMDDASIRKMFDVSGSVFAALRPGATHVCVTTISPHCGGMAREHAKRSAASFTSAGRFSGGPMRPRPASSCNSCPATGRR